LLGAEGRGRAQFRKEQKPRFVGAGGHLKRRNDFDAMIDEALVDCYTDSEMVTAMMTAIEDHLDLPFTTKVLGLTVNVVAVDLNEAGDVVALCTSNGKRQSIPLVDLPIPDPPPAGAQWVAAFRRFSRNR
jgi:hypothetical protein